MAEPSVNRTSQNATLNTGHITTRSSEPPETVSSKTAEQKEVEKNTLPTLTTDNDPELRANDNTPDNEPIVGPERPDISLICTQCQTYIDLRALKDHRVYHQSLEVMEYKNDSRPADAAALLKRRRNLIKKLKENTNSENPLEPSRLKKLNDAYEFLKTDLDDTFDEFRRMQNDVGYDVRGVALNCSAGCAFAVGMCHDANERWKSQMEDTRVYQDCFGNDPNKCFFAIYDGYHGRFAAEVAANELHQGLLMEMEKFDPKVKVPRLVNTAFGLENASNDMIYRAVASHIDQGNASDTSSFISYVIKDYEEKKARIRCRYKKREDVSSPKPKDESNNKSDMVRYSSEISRAFKKAHRYTDLLLSWGKDENSKVRWSGCSTLTCVIENFDNQSEEASHHSNQSEETSHHSNQSEEASHHSNQSEEASRHSNEDGCHDDADNKDEVIEDENEAKPKKYGMIHIANAGNVKGVLVRANKAHCLTKDHTPSNQRERNRVIQEGGSVNESKKELRVNGVLATTRGLGNHGDPSLKRCISLEPQTRSVLIDQYAQFLILASHGVWEVFTEQEAASLLFQVLPCNYLPATVPVSNSVRRLLADSKTTVTSDNQSQMLTDNQSEFPTDDQSEAPTDFQTANRVKEEKVFGGYYDNSTDKPSILRPQTGHSVKSKSSVSIVLQDTQHIISDDSSSESKHSTKTTESKKPEVTSRQKDHDFLAQSDSRADLLSESEGDYGGNESGNEADVDTDYTVPLTGLSSRVSILESDQDKVHRDYAQLLSERLVQSALLAGARDNITAIVILLPGCGL